MISYQILWAIVAQKCLHSEKCHAFCKGATCCDEWARNHPHPQRAVLVVWASCWLMCDSDAPKGSESKASILKPRKCWSYPTLSWWSATRERGLDTCQWFHGFPVFFDPNATLSRRCPGSACTTMSTAAWLRHTKTVIVEAEIGDKRLWYSL